MSSRRLDVTTSGASNWRASFPVSRAARVRPSVESGSVGGKSFEATDHHERRLRVWTPGRLGLRFGLTDRRLRVRFVREKGRFRNFYTRAALR